MNLLRISYGSPPRSSGLCLFLTAYFGLFVIGGVILFGSLPIIRRNSIATSVGCEIVKCKVTNSHSQLCISTSSSWDTPQKLKNEVKTLSHGRKINSFSRSFLEHLWPLSISNEINCTSLQEVTNTEFLAAGWTKIVYKGMFRGQKVAIKIARSNGQDVEECQKELGTTLATCFQRVNAKIIKEIILLRELAHDNVVKILGFCIPENDIFATLVTELGDPVDTLHLLQISWEDRLRLVLGMAQILHHFAYSPLGSLSMNDFRREQFVIVDGILKVSDLDDVGIGEPKCISDMTCQNLANIAPDSNKQEDIKAKISSCFDSHCEGYNSRMNIWHAGQHFVKLLLPIGAPETFQPYIQDLLAAYDIKENFDHGDVSYILQATQLLVNKYISGEYIQSNGGIEKLGFRRLDDGDLPGMFDYRCRYSISAVSCVLSVFNEEEAAQICFHDIYCKAVVLSKQQTWTGRTIAIFKNGFEAPVEAKGFTLLLKPLLL